MFVLATFNEKGIAESKMEMMFGLNAIKDLKRRD
jgi:hypothetical protein